MSFIHQPNDLINNRYIILKKIGQGGSAITYAAKDLQTELEVAIKVLSLQKLDDWKKIELFEREAKILQQLNHSSIPEYIDYFQIETEADNLFYIVQELAQGKSLFTLIEEGWQPDEKTVKEIAEQILEILIYLQQLIPPVIHRDIKPQNLIRSDRGEIFLVDFGAVQDTYHHTVMGSTVVGTYGYMAPEQFRGQAFLATDLYGLGTTLLFLLTSQSPAQLPQRKLKINFRNLVNISPEFTNWIDKLLEPNYQDRFPSAQDALEVLQGKQALNNYIRRKPPAYTLVSLTKTDEKLEITIPPAISYKKWSGSTLLFILTWCALFFFMTAGALISFWPIIKAGIIVYIFFLFIEIFLIDNFAEELGINNLNFIQSVFLYLLLFSMISFSMTYSNAKVFNFLINSATIYSLFLLIDRFIVAPYRISLIKNLLYPTQFQIFLNQGIRIIIKIKDRRFMDLEYTNFEHKPCKVEFSKSGTFLLMVVSFPQSGEKSKKYYFGGLLTNQEKLWLIEEFKNISPSQYFSAIATESLPLLDS